MSTTGTVSVQSLSLHAASPPRGESVPQSRNGGALWILTAVLLAAAAVIVYLGPRSRTVLGPADEFAISASDTDGRMRVTWNKNASMVEQADSARLEVVDGSQHATYQVDRAVLQAGTLDYLRHGQDLLLSLTLMHEGRPTHVAIIRSIGDDERASRVRRR